MSAFRQLFIHHPESSWHWSQVEIPINHTPHLLWCVLGGGNARFRRASVLPCTLTSQYFKHCLLFLSCVLYCIQYLGKRNCRLALARWTRYCLWLLYHLFTFASLVKLFFNFFFFCIRLSFSSTLLSADIFLCNRKEEGFFWFLFLVFPSMVLLLKWESGTPVCRSTDNRWLDVFSNVFVWICIICSHLFFIWLTNEVKMWTDPLQHRKNSLFSSFLNLTFMIVQGPSIFLGCFSTFSECTARSI